MLFLVTSVLLRALHTRPGHAHAHAPVRNWLAYLSFNAHTSVHGKSSANLLPTANRLLKHVHFRTCCIAMEESGFALCFACTLAFSASSTPLPCMIFLFAPCMGYDIATEVVRTTLFPAVSACLGSWLVSLQRYVCFNSAHDFSSIPSRKMTQ